MAIASFNFLRPAALPLASVPAIAQPCTGRADMPVVLDPGVVRGLFTSIGSGHGGMSLFSSELAVGMASDEHSLVANAWPLHDPDTGELLPPEDIFLYVIVAMVALSFYSVAHTMMTGGFQQWKKRRDQEQRAQRAMSTEERLENLLAKISPGQANGIPVRAPITIEDEREALRAGLDVLQVWHEILPTLPEDEAWEMALTREQVMDYLPPTFSLMITPGSTNYPRPNEEIIAQTVIGGALPDLESLLQKIKST